MIRWEGPIRVHLLGYLPDRYRVEVEAQLAELRELSRLAIEVVRGSAEELPPNMTIEFSYSRGGTTFEPDAPCRTLIWETNYVIRRVKIYIEPDPDELRRHCIAEELIKALGLASDSSVIGDSIFNDDDGSRQRIAPWDGLMVRMLYDARLSAGMSRTEAMPIVRRIIAEDKNTAGGKTSSPSRHR